MSTSNIGYKELDCTSILVKSTMDRIKKIRVPKGRLKSLCRAVLVEYVGDIETWRETMTEDILVNF
jgi:hypothetical protein